jgi:phytoene dehydrogenase-like protein
LSLSSFISNADPHVTFRKLVGRENLSWRRRLRLAATRWSVSALSLFFAVDGDLRALGLDSGNVWWYAHDDIDAIYRLGMDPRALHSAPPGLFIAASTLKDPSKMRRGRHVLEAFSFVPWESFRAFAASRSGDRPEGYKALKEELKATLIRAVERAVPGIERRIVFSDLGTPLTNLHYCAASFGNLYGTEKSRLQMGPFSFSIKTEFPGLLMCGASTLSHGVFGAAASGLVAAAVALRCRPRELLAPGGPPIREYPSERPDAWPEAERRKMDRERAGAAAVVA